MPAQKGLTVGQDDSSGLRRTLNRPVRESACRYKVTLEGSLFLNAPLNR